MYRMRSLHLLRPRCALAWHADELAHKHTSKKSCELVGGGHVSAHIPRRIRRRVAVDQPAGTGAPVDAGAKASLGSSAARLRENIDALSFTLDAEAMAAVDGLEADDRDSFDPRLIA